MADDTSEEEVLGTGDDLYPEGMVTDYINTLQAIRYITVSSLPPSASPLIVKKTADWYDRSVPKIQLVVEQVCKNCMNHGSWSVRMEVVDWAYSLLSRCHK